MNYKYFGILITCVLLSVCNVASLSKAQTSAAWALGKKPIFRGVIEDWAKGDAIASSEGSINAISYSGGDPEGSYVGEGVIEANGNFAFTLKFSDPGHPVGDGFPVSQVLCTGLKLSNSRQKIVLVDILQIDSVYQEGTHARPGGAIFISVARPNVGSPATLELYTFIYANRTGTIKGSCTSQDLGTASYDLNLRKGWNSVRRTQTGFKTAAIPKAAKWYFFSTLTFGQ